MQLCVILFVNSLLVVSTVDCSVRLPYGKRLWTFINQISFDEIAKILTQAAPDIPYQNRWLSCGAIIFLAGGFKKCPCATVAI